MSDNNIPTPEERRRERQQSAAGGANSVMRAIFGIIMIIIYVGMGILLLINFFDWGGDWAWTLYVVGYLVVFYGFWLANRQIKGID